MAEITDQQLANYNQVMKLFDKLRAPATKFAFEDLIKQVEPNAPTTKDDLKPALTEIAQVRETVEKINERFKKMDDDAADEKFFKAMDDLKSKHGLTEEGAEKLKQIMKEKIIPDPYVAFDHMRAREPKEKPPSAFAPMGWGFGAKTDDKDVQHLFEDPDSWAEKEARLAWNETAR